MVWRIGNVFGFLAVIVFCGFFAGISGCKTEEKFGRFTEEEMARFDAQKSMRLPAPTGGSVLSVGGETLSANEVIRMLEDTERIKSPTVSRDIRTLARSQSAMEFYGLFSEQVEQIVKWKVAQLLVYEKAKIEAGDSADDAVKKYIQKEKSDFRAKYGDNYAKADQALKSEGYSSWKDFNDKKKRKILVDIYLSKRSGKMEAITYGALREYYENNPDLYHAEATIEYEYIDIVLSDLDIAEVDMDKGMSSGEVGARIANGLVVRIEAGADMGELAMETFPEKYANKTDVYDKARVDDLLPPYDAFARYAKRMLPGDVTEPIKSEDHVLIMKLLEYSEEKNLAFEEVRDEIQSVLEEARFINQRGKIDLEALDETNVEDLDKFVKLCVMQAYKRWKG